MYYVFFGPEISAHGFEPRVYTYYTEQNFRDFSMAKVFF